MARQQRVASLASPPEAESPDDQVRLAILRVTYRLLEERGYAAVTTDDIAAEARVSKATIYRLWRTKQQLVVDAARMRLGNVDAPDLGSFRAEVHWILEHRMRDYRDPRTLRLVGEFVGAAVSDPQLQRLFGKWVNSLSGSIRRVVERGLERGDVRSDVDVSALGILIAGVVARTVIAQKSFSPDEVDSIVRLIVAAAAPYVSQPRDCTVSDRGAAPR